MAKKNLCIVQVEIKQSKIRIILITLFVLNKRKRMSYTIKHKKTATEWNLRIIYSCKNLFKLIFKILCLKSHIKTELKIMSGKVFLVKHTAFNTFFFTRLVNSKMFKSMPSSKIRFIAKIQIKMSKNTFNITINTFE